jgi:hypothetical protein
MTGCIQTQNKIIIELRKRANGSGIEGEATIYNTISIYNIIIVCKKTPLRITPSIALLYQLAFTSTIQFSQEKLLGAAGIGQSKTINMRYRITYHTAQINGIAAARNI